MNTESAPSLASGGRSRRERWLLIALLVSLALNLLVAGAVVGRLLSGPPPGPMPRHLGWIVQGLDASTRAEIAPQLRDNLRAAGPLRRAMGDAQQDFLLALRTEPLDKAALAAALDDIQASSAAYQALMHAQMVEVLGQLDQAQRRQVVDYLNQRRSRHGDRPAGGRGAPPDDAPPP